MSLHAPELLAKSTKYTTQRHLHKVLHELFHGKNIYENTRRRSNIVSPISGHFLELDFWIPELKLAFEFQDPHHYVSLGYSNAPLNEIKERDSIKKWQMDQRGEALIIVPYWWDGKHESLAASIRLYRKDLEFDLASSSPIPDDPPSGSFTRSIPEIGEFMMASLLDTNTKFDPTNWWMGEKCEGLRICWNPTDGKLYSRLGIEVNIPSQFVSHFPAILLDGELWFGRANANEALQVVKSSNAVHNTLSFLKFVAYDCPDKANGGFLFEKAHERILQSVDKIHPFICIPSFMESKGKLHVAKTIKEVIGGDGSGIFIRDKNSAYEHGRSNSLLKFEGREIKEGLVVALTKTAYELRLVNGVSLYVPIDNEMKGKREKKRKRVQIGDVVTLTGVTDIKIDKVRKDITWHDLKSTNKPHLRVPLEIDFFEGTKNLEKRKPFGHWTQTDGENIKKFFNILIEKKKMDPLVAENWYSLTTDDILAQKGGGTILKHYGGSVAKLLIDIFPHLNLDEGKFSRKPHHYWSYKPNRRKFMEELALENGLDALLPHSWYSFPHSSIILKKGGAAFFNYYKKLLVSAVLDLFPEINADPKKFPSIFRNHWLDVNNQKQFFDKFAAKRGFDPLVSSNWYTVSLSDVFLEKHGRMVVKRNKGSVARTLMGAYPSIGLDPRLFSTVSQGYWNDKNNRREFFDSIARKNGFDPLNPQNWYSLEYSDVINEKSGQTVLNLYRYSIVNALVDVYPELGLEPAKFTSASKKFWSHTNKRNYFEKFARQFNIDPLNVTQWYQVSLQSFKSNKGLGNMVSLCYGGSFVNALMDLYPQIGLEKSKFKLK